MSGADSSGRGGGNWWSDLPVDRVRDEFFIALQGGAVVLTAPTGSGKSTLVPRWCLETRGRTLVVEPRRVACRALWRFQREMGGVSVGYLVRHEQQDPDADLLYVTPGVALRMMSEDGSLGAFSCLVFDEFHERSLETDLLAALVKEQDADQGLVVMSATIDTKPLAKWLDAEVIEAQGRVHPVSISYLGGVEVPTSRGLEDRVVEAVGGLLSDLGRYDVLVFLPGRGEIGAARSALQRRFASREVVELHAGLPAERQDRVFRRPSDARVVLATNVAESSVTLPWVRAVVDSGLERRTSYRRGRSVLSLEVISQQSADQRAGRAGRLGPGRCVRLWALGALLRERSVPEILREDLDDLVLHCARMGKKLDEIPFLDPPRPDVTKAAEHRLVRLGLLDEHGALTELGRRAALLPLDPDLARLVLAGVDCGDQRVAEDLVDLAASLSTPGPLFSSNAGRDRGRGDGRRAGGRRGHRRGGRPGADRAADLRDDERQFHSDVDARVAAVRGRVDLEGVRPAMLSEARRVARQLRVMLGLTQDPPDRPALSGSVLGPVIIDALPDFCFVRRRGRYAGSGMEASLSAVSFVPDSSDALLVFDIHSARRRGMKAEHEITCAMPVGLSLLARAGLGHQELVRVDRLAGGQLVGRVSTVHASVALDVEERELSGALACKGAARLFVQGRWLKGGRDEVQAAREREALYLRMEGRPIPEDLQEELEDWVTHRLEELGVQSGGDLDLISVGDLLPRDLDEERIREMDRRFPVRLKLVDRVCEVRYEVSDRRVVLVHRSGRRDPPPRPSDLPLWPGWTVLYKVHSRTWRLR